MPPNNDRKRIALLVHALYGGGAERLMSNLAAHWANDHDVHLVTWATRETDQYSVPNQVKRHGLDLMQPSGNVLSGLLANFRRVQTLRKTLREIQPDFILSFSDQMNIVALQSALPIDVPTWISERSDPAKQTLGLFWETWRRRVYHHCTGCVVVSDGIADTMTRWIDSNKIHVIPPAIYPPNESTDHGVQPEPGNYVLFVGRLSREKRVDTLVRAWKHVHSQLPDWQLLLVGDGAERRNLIELAAGLSSIKFEGWSSNPVGYYQAADIFVLPSDYEGFPGALLEAMHHGLACVSTRSTVVIDQLNAVEPCIETMSADADQELSRIIWTLAQDAGQRATRSAAAKRVAQQYTWDKIRNKWDAILQD